ncbi:MAG: TPM domain-containing protein [Clostridiales bacterium]|nr:TPM domain-containing protein [Clostridiales bacterium]
MKMKQLKKHGRVMTLLLMACLLLGTLFPAAMADAEEKTSQAVYDDAGLFTEEQKASLESYAKKYGEKAKVSYYIVTKNVYLKNDFSGYLGNIESYTENLSERFYDEVAKADGNEDAVILTIVIEYDSFTIGKKVDPDDHTDRYADVSGQGYGKERLDDNRAQMVFNKIKPQLSRDDYEQAAEKMMQVSYQYMKFRPGIDPSLFIFRLWFQILLALIVGGVVVGMMVYHSGGKITVNDRTYLDTSTSRILARRDTYLRTTVTKTKKESSSSGGGGGGHSGGGGGSHGGGHF